MYENAPHDMRQKGPADDAPASTLRVGVKVCVWNHFLNRWSGGFEVAEVVSFGYRLRRVSDGQVFGDVFAFDDVQVERRRNPMRGTEDSHLDRVT